MICSRTRPVSCPCSSRTLESLFGRCLATNTFKVFREGDEAEIRRVFTVQDVQNFVDFTGDTNPIHVDVNFAKKTRFGQLVIHGVLLNCLISAVHGTKLPGHGCMILFQSFKYPTPLFCEEEVLAHVKVASIRHSIMRCDVICTAVHRGKVVLSGETKLLIPNKRDV
ncbi:hydroxyacyl-thioester dehydratase type 2, mitochondrial-like [Montipora foliosa]|uniref:hydroxyacyl-thioester dehydratase type 2, mitochondrial-like n=1 Tax=Montipora foliosa TaxID=591990 RepID=UPI0035F1BC9C